MKYLIAFQLLIGQMVFVPAFAQTRKVFAHYMVCNKSYGGGTVEGYKRDIKDAQLMGIDGFALNEGAWDANYKQNTERLFQAALELNTNFKFFFSADGCCGLQLTAVEDMIKTYVNHPNYFKYNNRAFLSAWSYGVGKSAKIFWTNYLSSLKDKGYNIYFIPFLFPQDFSETPDLKNIEANFNSSWKYFLDGYFYFGAAGLPTGEKHCFVKSGEAAAKTFHDSGLTYMASVCPYYWGGKQIPGRRYYEFNGGEGISAQWNSILSLQKPEWVELVTWNDWDEGSYFSPMDDIIKYWPWTEHKKLGFYKTHKGFAELNRYYIDWYKSGEQPLIKTDNVYFFYRTHPKNAKATNDPKGPVTWMVGDIKDEIYVTTILKSSATLIVNTGNVKKKYKVEAGVKHTRIPFNTGQQSFELRRNLRRIIFEQGEDILSEIKEYNFNLYSGSGSVKVKNKH